MKINSQVPEEVGPVDIAWQEVQPNTELAAQLTFCPVDSASPQIGNVEDRLPRSLTHKVLKIVPAVELPGEIVELAGVVDSDFREQIALGERVKTKHFIQLRSGNGNPRPMRSDFLRQILPSLFNAHIPRGVLHVDHGDAIEKGLTYVVTEGVGTVFWDGEYVMPYDVSAGYLHASKILLGAMALRWQTRRRLPAYVIPDGMLVRARPNAVHNQPEIFQTPDEPRRFLRDTVIVV